MKNEDILEVNFKEEWKELIDLSFTVITHMELSRDSLAELLKSLEVNFIKLTKLHSKCFMFAFLDQEDVQNMCWGGGV